MCKYMKINQHFFTSFVFLASIITLCFGVVSCKDEDDTYAAKYVTGTLSYNVDDYYPIGTNTSFTATTVKITAPVSMDSVILTWNAIDFAPKTGTGKNFTTTLPSTTGSYSMSLVASADAYNNLSKTSTITMIPTTFFETVTGLKASADTLTDNRDGKTEKYPYVRIGNLDWFVRNLNYKENGIGRNYKDQEGYGIIFGRFYSGSEVATGNICPSGWRIPNNADWEDLGKALNKGVAVTFKSHWPNLGQNAAAPAKLLDAYMWDGYNQATTRANTLGWNAIPTGKISGNAATEKSSYAYWWSATPDTDNSNKLYFRYIQADNPIFYFGSADTTNVYFPVRCVKN